MLGALRHQRTVERKGYRNGSYERRWVTETGPLELLVPRARIADETGVTREHASEMLPKYERRNRRVNEAIVACYLAGANTRRVRKALEPLLGGSQLSKSAISRVVTKLKTRFDTWRERDLSEEGSFVFSSTCVFGSTGLTLHDGGWRCNGEPHRTVVGQKKPSPQRGQASRHGP